MTSHVVFGIVLLSLILLANRREGYMTLSANKLLPNSRDILVKENYTITATNLIPSADNSLETTSDPKSTLGAYDSTAYSRSMELANKLGPTQVNAWFTPNVLAADDTSGSKYNNSFDGYKVPIGQSSFMALGPRSGGSGPIFSNWYKVLNREDSWSRELQLNQAVKNIID